MNDSAVVFVKILTQLAPKRSRERANGRLQASILGGSSDVNAPVLPRGQIQDLMHPGVTVTGNSVLSLRPRW